MRVSPPLLDCNFHLWTFVFTSIITALFKVIYVLYDAIWGFPNKMKYTRIMNIFPKLVEKGQGESDDRFLDMCIEVCEDNAKKFQLQVLGGAAEVPEHYMKMEARGLWKEAKELEDKAEEKTLEEKANSVDNL
jgi:hypothetical protein